MGMATGSEVQMIHFLDKCFCNQAIHKVDCTRQWTPELEKQAREWWGPEGDPPVAFANLCGGEEHIMENYIKPAVRAKNLFKLSPEAADAKQT